MNASAGPIESYPVSGWSSIGCGSDICFPLRGGSALFFLKCFPTKRRRPNKAATPAIDPTVAPTVTPIFFFFGCGGSVDGFSVPISVGVDDVTTTDVIDCGEDIWLVAFVLGDIESEVSGSDDCETTDSADDGDP